jgi:predicted TIM-barrel fold metal-dependent hydrolase
MQVGRIAALLCLLCLTATPSWAGEIPIIDAHSQLERKVAPERVIELMDAAGVSRTILAARRGTSVKDMKAFAARHPDRITAAVRTKGGAYQDKDLAAFQAFLAKQTKSRQFAAMAEVLIFHHIKRNKKGKVVAPEVAYPLDHEKVRAALAVTLERGWPFIAHIEFASLGFERDSYMAGSEAMLDAHPDHPFILIHLGQLDPGEIARLIAAHANISFITAHSNPITVKRSREPWTDMFRGEQLAPPWRALIVAHPDRFVLGFDNVWANHWEELYLPQVVLWRKVLADLPEDVAHALAHRNAERLWRLPQL